MNTFIQNHTMNKNVLTMQLQQKGVLKILKVRVRRKAIETNTFLLDQLGAIAMFKSLGNRWFTLFICTGNYVTTTLL